MLWVSKALLILEMSAEKGSEPVEYAFIQLKDRREPLNLVDNALSVYA